MHKLTLKLEELAVESFDTQAVREGAGTVFGQASQAQTCPVNETCDGDATCYASCYAGCDSHFCPPTEDPSCEQVSCIIWSCQSCKDHTCSCIPGECP